MKKIFYWTFFMIVILIILIGELIQLWNNPEQYVLHGLCVLLLIGMFCTFLVFLFCELKEFFREKP